MQEPSIILDFTKKDFSDAVICEDENLLHRSKMEEAMSLWRELHKKAIEESKIDDFTKFNTVHDTISVFGSRGAGKTTFLLTFVDKIKKEYPDVLCLDHIDPSLIEPKLHPFVSILASLHKEVNATGLIKECDPCDRNYDQYKRYTNLYNQLLKALPSIDGVGNDNLYEKWVDNEYIAQKGMQRAETHNQLDVLFNQYVKLSLKLIGKTVLVIPFDDIDTDFHKGYVILEVIRKYLINRQIVSILTGDMDLYAKLVRQASWESFTPEYLKNEIEYSGYKGKDFSSMIDQLEAQYLIKILKPEKRIMLKTMGEYIDENRDIRVRFNDGTSLPFVHDCYSEIIELTGIKTTNKAVTKDIQNFLQNQSLRTQIRLLTCLKRCKDNPIYRPLMANYLLHVFENDITQKTPATKSLFRESSTFVIEMLQFLLRTGSLFKCTKFLPVTTDDALNKSLFSIGAFFNKQVSKGKKSYMVLDYWIRIAMNQTLLANLKSTYADDNQNTLFDSYFAFTYMNSDVELTKALGLAFAFANGKLNEFRMPKHPDSPNNILAGTMRLQHKHYEYKTVSDRLATMAMLGTMEDENRENVFVSVFRILAAIRDIMAVLDKTTDDDVESIVKQFNLQISRYCQYLYYKEPASKLPKEAQNNMDEAKYDAEINPEIEYIDNSFIGEFIGWAKENVMPSCELLERIYTRFYFTCINIDANHNYHNAAEKLSAHIVALLNAALVEESIDANLSGIVFNNIGDINEIYITNLYQYRNNHSDTSLGIHNWLSTCPLLLVYLRKEIYNLIDSKTVPVTDVINQMRYDRISYSIDRLKKRLDNLNLEKDTCDKAIIWFTSFRKMIHLREDISVYKAQLKNKALNPETFDSLKADYDRLRNQHDNLELLLANGVDIPALGLSLNYKMDYTDVDHAFISVIGRLSGVGNEISNLEKQIKDYEEYRDNISKGNLPEPSYPKFNVYDILQQYNVI